MTTLMPGLFVPSDVISLVCQNLERHRDLSSASLVSRAWYGFAFPHLHREMCIDSLYYLELLMDRIEAETRATHTRLSLCLKSLVFGYTAGEDEWDSWPKGIGSNSRFLRRVQKCAPKLKNLEHIDWSTLDLPPTRLLKIFWKSCPRLHMANLTTWSYDYMSLTSYGEMFRFENLTHLNITGSLEGHIQPSGISGAILRAIDRCPDLVELSIYCSNTWRLTEFLRALTNPLSKLTRLAIGGDCEVDWSELVLASPTELSLRSFFEGRPGLRQVDFGCSFVHKPDLKFTPETMQDLFPSLTSFTGSATMCAGVVSSSLAGQLESLAVCHESGNDTYSIGTLADLTKPLPKLKELRFIDEEGISEEAPSRNLDMHSLEKMLTATPVLRTLALEYFKVEPDRLLSPLRRAPMLNELTIRSDSYLLDKLPVGDPFIDDLTKTCPVLVRLAITSEDDRSRWLNIHRSLDGSLCLQMRPYTPIDVSDSDSDSDV